MGTLVEGYERAGGIIYRLTRIDKPHLGRKFGWYLDDPDGTPLEGFYMPLTESEIIIRKRAREHARHLGFHIVKVYECT